MGFGLWIDWWIKPKHNLEDILLKSVDKIKDMDLYVRAAFLGTMQDLGVPLEYTKTYQLLDESIRERLNECTADRYIEVEVNKNGVLYMLIEPSYFAMLYSGMHVDVDDICKFDTCIFMLIVNTDFYGYYQEWVEGVCSGYAAKTRFICVKEGENIQNIEYADISIALQEHYNIFSQTVWIALGEVFKKKLVLRGGIYIVYNLLCTFNDYFKSSYLEVWLTEIGTSALIHRSLSHLVVNFKDITSYSKFDLHFEFNKEDEPYSISDYDRAIAAYWKNNSCKTHLYWHTNKFIEINSEILYDLFGDTLSIVRKD